MFSQRQRVVEKAEIVAPRIALFGAAGAIGESVARALRAQGIPYRVVGRTRSTLERVFGQDPLAEIAVWNPDDPASVRSAARGIETIVYLVGVNYWQFELHPQLMTKTLEGAIAEGVKQMVLIGTVYPFGRPRTALVSENHPREPHTFKGKMRKQQEDLLMEADAKGRIRGTVLRLPDFYGPGVEKSFLESAFQAAVTGKTAQMLGPVDRPHEFIYVPDVGPVVAKLIAEPRAFGRTWNLASAGPIAPKEFVAKIFAQAGKKPKTMVAGKTVLRVMGLFNPLMRELVEMHYLLTEPVLMDDTDLRNLLGPIHKTPYDEGIRRTLEAARKASSKSN
jgi:nucleoside-diphosphate-sugar epimerase